MNKTTKAISSPGRSTEKFPPPLMRFLRSNMGNKSRRRSRASPMSMFVKKKNTPFETTTTQEPSSPKVTCIGQVRVRRSNKNINHNHRVCHCFRTIKSFSLITVWSKCVMFFRYVSCCCYCCCCYCCCNNNNRTKKHLQHQKEKQVQQKKQQQEEVEEQEHQGDIERHQQQHQKEEENKHVALQVDDINVGLIPNNALLLTRCRSAPYRSANSLASMFKESMVEKNVELEDEEKNKKIKIEKKDEENVKKLMIKKEDEDEGEGEEDEEGTSNESDGCEESKVVPLILSRCKSEPARTWDKLLLL